MQLQVGVKALLQNSEGKYLLIKRNPETYTGVSARWDLPGGRIEAGASLLENLKREIKEETNLDLLKEPRLIAAQDIFASLIADSRGLHAEERRMKTKMETSKRETFHVVRLTYTGEIEGDVILSKEHTDFRWVTFEELKIFEPLDSYVKKLLEEGVIRE